MTDFVVSLSINLVLNENEINYMYTQGLDKISGFIRYFMILSIFRLYPA